MDLLAFASEVEMTTSDSDESEEKFDLQNPECVLIEIVGEMQEGALAGSWKGWSIESCTILSSRDENTSGTASYENAYGGFLDYTIKDITDCPQKEGWFVIENITATFLKGDGWMTDDDMDFECEGIRPATEEEIKLA